MDSESKLELQQWSNYVGNKHNLALDVVAFLIAKTLQYPSLKIDEQLQILDSKGNELEDLVNQKERPTEIVAAVNEYIFERHGFTGNTEDYHDPRNSYLNDVLARKKGIPITLSVLYIELAKRIGSNLQGVGFPGHFLIKYVDDDLEIVIDPFNKGKILTYEDYQLLLDQLYNGKIKFEKRFLNPVTTEQILIRMLRNLKNAFSYSYDYNKALMATDMILAINPELAEEFRDKGLLFYYKQRYADALSNLTRYLEMLPEASDADQVMDIIRNIQSLSRNDIYK